MGSYENNSSVFETPCSLFSSCSILPNRNKSDGENMNALVRGCLLIFIILLIIDHPYKFYIAGALFVTLILLHIFFSFYHKKNYRENFRPDRAPAQPKTYDPPVIAGRSHDLDVWGNGMHVHSGINDTKVDYMAPHVPHGNFYTEANPYPLDYDNRPSVYQPGLSQDRCWISKQPVQNPVQNIPTPQFQGKYRTKPQTRNIHTKPKYFLDHEIKNLKDERMYVDDSRKAAQEAAKNRVERSWNGYAIPQYDSDRGVCSWKKNGVRVSSNSAKPMTFEDMNSQRVQMQYGPMKNYGRAYYKEQPYMYGPYNAYNDAFQSRIRQAPNQLWDQNTGFPVNVDSLDPIYQHQFSLSDQPHIDQWYKGKERRLYSSPLGNKRRTPMMTPSGNFIGHHDLGPDERYAGPGYSSTTFNNPSIETNVTEWGPSTRSNQPATPTDNMHPVPFGPREEDYYFVDQVGAGYESEEPQEYYTEGELCEQPYQQMNARQIGVRNPKPSCDGISMNDFSDSEEENYWDGQIGQGSEINMGSNYSQPIYNSHYTGQWPNHHPTTDYSVRYDHQPTDPDQQHYFAQPRTGAIKNGSCGCRAPINANLGISAPSLMSSHLSSLPQHIPQAQDVEMLNGTGMQDSCTTSYDFFGLPATDPKDPSDSLQSYSVRNDPQLKRVMPMIGTAQGDTYDPVHALFSVQNTNGTPPFMATASPRSCSPSYNNQGDCGATMNTVRDGRLVGNSALQPYTMTMLGQTRYDTRLVDAYRQPNFISRANVEFGQYYTPDGRILPEYYRAPGGARQVAENEFINNTTEFRESIMTSQMRKRNEEMSQLRRAPLRSDSNMYRAPVC